MISLGMRRLLAAMIALACLTSVAQAQTRALTIRDVVTMSSFGLASIDPTGRWAVYERRGPYDTAPVYDMDHRSIWGASELWIAPVAGSASPARLLPAGAGPGLLLGAWSPSGRRLLISRLRGGRLEAGVMDMTDRSVWWTGLAPDWGLTGSVAAWIDEDRLGLTIFPDGGLPYLLRQPGSVQAVMPQRWDAQRAGRVATRTVIDTDRGVATSEFPERPQALVLLDLAQRETRVLAAGRIRDWAAAPDGQTIAVLKAGPGIPVAQDTVQQLAPLERGRLELIDVATGRPRPLARDWDVAGQLLRWSADSESLLIWVREDGRSWTDGDLARVSSEGALTLIPRGELAPLVPGGDIDHLAGIKADWLGTTAILYARPTDGTRFDWNALPEGGAPRILTAGLTSVPSRLSAIDGDTALLFADGTLWAAGGDRPLRLSPEGQSVSEALRPDRMLPVRLRVNTPPRRDWALAIGDAGTISRIDHTGRMTSLGAVDSEADSRVLGAVPEAAVSLSRDHGVETLTLARGGQRRDLDRVNAGFADLVMSRPTAIPHLDSAGRPTTSYLFLPPVTAATVKGIVVLAYPGAADDGSGLSAETMLFGPRAAMIAAEGYAVLSPAIPVEAHGSGKIAEFEANIDLAVSAMASMFPQLPTDRMALLGHSFGGYLTLAIAARSTRYRSYVAWAAPSDLFGAWGEFIPQSRAVPEDGSTLRQRMGWVEANQGGMPGPPWAAPDAYLKESPVMTANRITAPILLINADMDFVPLSQAQEVFSAINRSGSRARLATYWGEGHFMFSPANIIDVYQQIIGWLDETLAKPNLIGGSAAASPTDAPTPPLRP